VRRRDPGEWRTTIVMAASRETIHYRGDGVFMISGENTGNCSKSSASRL
jgi:hypothetical protein